MPESKFSRLELVPLRTGWSHEARDFTTWLAQEQNLELLSEVIGIELECEGCEQAVGPFSADILCKDISTDKWVLIENQIECTDHKHLGQLITYAAGLKACTVIWIAAEFREEHRAALDWLNEITSEDFNFIGIEIQLWRIGDSLPAPRFHIISKPNNWSRQIRETAVDHQLRPAQILQLNFWTGFMDYLKAHNYKKQTPKPLSQHWMNFPVGRSQMKLSVVISTYNNTYENWDIGELRVEFVIEGKDAEALYNELLKYQNKINDQLCPLSLQWVFKENVKMKKISTTIDSNLYNEDLRPEQYKWLADNLQKFEQVFKPIVATLANKKV